MRISVSCSPFARLGLARRLLDRLEAAGDQLRRHAAARRCCSPIRPSPCRSSSCRKPLPLPGQLKPLPGRKTAPPEPADPHVRVDQANAAARVQPTRAGYINAMQVYPFSDGALYQVYAAPGQVTDIALQQGEQLVGSGPVAAGDTVRWIIGDTESGTGADQARPHPRQADARGPHHQPHHQHRPAHLPSRAALHREDLYGVGLLDLSAGPAHRAAPAECRGRGGSRRRAPASTSTRCNFRYRIEGDTPPWRPLRAFDDGRQVFIEFPTGIGQGEMPPLWVIGAEGDGRARQLSRPGQSHDRRPAVRGGRAAPRRRAAEEGAHRAHRWEAAVVTDVPNDPAAGPGERRARPRDALAARAGRPSRASRARCFRPWLVAARRRSRRAVLGLAAQAADDGRRALQHRQPHHAGRPLPTCRATMPACRSPFRSSGRRCPAISAGRSSMRSAASPACHADGTRRSREADASPRSSEAARTSRPVRDHQRPSRALPHGRARARACAHGDTGRLRTTDPATQDRKLAFLNGTVDRRTVSPDRVDAPASPYVLQAGAVIPAALLTGLRSDLPGQVTAQVTEDVYDSPTGRILLIPQGARLIGQYDAQVAFGQSRALLVWNRLIMPNGRSIVLERQPGADAGRLCRPRGRGRQSLGHAVQGRDPLDAAQRRLGSRHAAAARTS